MTGPTHMKGWETFGAVPGGAEPISRPLGLVTFPKRTDEIVIEEGTEEFSDDGVQGGVATVEIHSHGDSPTGAYVYVCGPDRAAVEACFDEVVDRLAGFLSEVWP